MKDQVLEHVNPARREFLKKLLTGAAFAAPVIATFSVEALMPEPAYGVVNQTACAPPAPLAPPPFVGPTACPGPACVPPPTPLPVVPVVPACPTNQM